MEIDSDCIVVGGGPKRKAATQHRKKGKKRKTTKKGSQKTVVETPVPNPHLYNIGVTEWWCRRAQRRSSWEASNTEEDADFDSGDEDDPFPRKEDFF